MNQSRPILKDQKHSRKKGEFFNIPNAFVQN